MKSRIVAILLAFFLGMFGLHKFYLNQNGKGLIYLVLTFTGVGAIVTLIFVVLDFLSLVLTSDEKFHQIYDKK